MLSKSLKHEFRATSRVMLPIFIAMILLSLAAHFATVLLAGDNLPRFLEGISVTVIVLFVAGMVAAAVSVIALTVVRFYRSFLSDEGYLNMTLPVSVNTHISSRLIVSVVWYTLTAIAGVLCVMLMVMGLNQWKDFWTGMADLFRQIKASGMTGHAILLGLEMLISCVISSAFTSLLLYAALAVGHSFNRRKKFLSVVFAFVFYYAVQILSTLGIVALTQHDWSSLTAKFDLEPLKVIPFMEGMMGIGILIILLLCAVFYFITHHFLSRKLNLE